jgi:DNA-binding SARP family transcriptional activator
VASVPGQFEFGVLGPLVVHSGGRELALPRGRVQTLLAALLLDAGRVVSADALTEVLWPAEPPLSAPALIRHHIWQLRQVLGAAGAQRVVTSARGYLIRVGEDELDLPRFEHLLALARTAADSRHWEQAAAQAAQALALWRGEPLAGVESETLAAREVPRLAELRLQAAELRLEAALHRGGHAEAAAELARLAAAHPLREHVHALLMLACHRCGRRADALAAYQRARARLVEELGAEPGFELQQIHQQILAGDPALDLLAAPGPRLHASAGVTARVPRQLPGAVAGFTGRAPELAALAEVLDESGGGAPGTVVISAIGGTAGVGKTALAIRFAHQAASRFPDGQLYVNLRGFDPAGTPVAPAEAIRGFLDALGLPPERVPPSAEAQEGLYRSLLADKRMLIVLDNARDEQQVRPLLPASPATLVLITSRNQLAGLAAADGAPLLTLDVLSHAEATQMLGTRIGAARAAAEPDAVSEIARLCTCLPLALAVAAARAAARPRLPLAALADELRDAATRLDALDAGDPAVSVRAVFSWSTTQLSPDTARMFRLLGIHPGPEITAPAAASLTATGPAQARRALAELTRAQLVAEQVPGRYALHDLLRAYAASQAGAAEDQQARDAATQRVLDHYLHTAHAAAVLINPSLDLLALATPAPGVTPEHLASHQQALAWLQAEHQVLLAAATLAASTGSDAHAWQIPWAITDFLDRRGRWYEQATLADIAVAAATRLGDTKGRAMSLRLLAFACWRLGDDARALAQCAAAVGLYQQLGDRLGEARARQFLALLSDSRGRYADALSGCEQVLRLYQAVGHRPGEARMLNNIGWTRALLGDYRQARASCQQSLALYAELDERYNVGHAWDTLGYAEHHLGNLAEAAACYQRALGIHREFGDLVNEADTLIRLGDTRHASGELSEVRVAWQQALDILDELQHPDAAKVRDKLASVNNRPIQAAPMTAG